MNMFSEKGAQIKVKDLQNKLPFQHLSDYSEWLSSKFCFIPHLSTYLESMTLVVMRTM